MKKHDIFLIIALLLFTVVGVTFLFHKTDIPNTSDQSPRIAAIMIDPNVVFWNDVWQGVWDAASENHIALSEYPYEQYTSDISELIETAVVSKVDGILLRSQDTPSDSLQNALKTARDHNISIVTLDVDASKDCRDSFISIDNHAAATELAKKAAELLPKDKSVAIVKTPDEHMSQAASSRVTAFQEEFKKIRPECNFTIFNLPADEGMQLPALMQFLENETSLGLIFGCAPKVTSVSINAVSRLNLIPEIDIVGFSESQESIEALKTGIVKCLVVQDPYTMGKTSLEYLYRLCSYDAETINSLISTPFRIITSDNFDISF